jgi:hypothetical protein
MDAHAPITRAMVASEAACAVASAATYRSVTSALRNASFAISHHSHTAKGR